MKNLTTNEIRDLWLEFWKEKEHYIVEPKSLVPKNDNSLLFINSGVATLKNYLSGKEKPPNNRLANSQKSIRTNDIENVGITARHHTMFEMLGNFSIGDYFKKEAIAWGYELLTSSEYFDMDVNDLYFTVHPDDTESYNLWLEQGIKEERIVKTYDNFWEIGKGPGGPNTEIFFDRGEKYDKRDVRKLLEEDLENDRAIEIWNIVFSQYNCDPELEHKDYPELPQKNIDTGMGLERMTCVLQNVETNFETDNFKVIMDDISKITNTIYKENKKAYRIIADHIRSLTFAIADGVIPANEGRGYVIRRILRRAVKYAYIDLNVKEPFLYNLVYAVVKQMEFYYPYLNEHVDSVKEIVKKEEERFLQTLNEGIKHFENNIKEIDGKTIPGEVAFKLYDTYGFPVELTEELAQEKGLEVDIKVYEKELEKQKQRARKARKDISGIDVQNNFLKEIDVESKFVGYTQTKVNTTVVFITDGDKELEQIKEGQKAFIILKETPFYATSGGQKCDLADTDILEVINVSKLANGQHLHEVIAKRDISKNESIEVEIDVTRRNKIKKNHSATHLLHYSLSKILGNQITQAGSDQDDKRTRFDYTYNGEITKEKLNTIQKDVNEQIGLENDSIIEEMTIDEAKSKGAKAQFDEKYGNVVRVIQMGDSIELCGGTHVENTKEIEKFLIINEQSIGSGIRRIEALTADLIEDYAKEKIIKMDLFINEAKENIINEKTIKFNEIDKLLIELEEINQVKEINIVNYQNEIERLKKENEKILQKSLETKEGNIKNVIIDLEEKVNTKEGINYLEEEIEGISSKDLKLVADKLMEKVNSGVIILKLIEGSKISIVVKVSDDLTDKYHAGKIIKEKLEPYGGRGGGKPTMAQGGGEI